MRRLCGIATLVVVAVSASGCAAGIVNKPPSDVTETSATVNGIVWTTDGGEVAYWVEYGTTTAYGQETAQRTTKLAEDTPHDVSIPLDGLTPSTTWHYRICAEDAQAGREQPRWIIESRNPFGHGKGSSDDQQRRHAAKQPAGRLFHERRLTDEHERHEQEQVFKYDEQCGVVPNPPSREHNGRADRHHRPP